MTGKQLLDKVPWADMRLVGAGYVRHQRTNACPICAAFGLDGSMNASAIGVAEQHRLSTGVAGRIINAADDDTYGKSIRMLRAEMLRRMDAARGEL